MSATQFLFWFLSTLALISATMMVVSKNPVHSVLWLIVVFFAISGHYVLLNAQFLAIVNFIVYMGAIMVLFLFVIMLLNLNKDTEPVKTTLVKFAAIIGGGCLLVTVIASVKAMGLSQPVISKVADLGLVKNLGKVLFGEFLLPFEISSLLLLSAMVGAVLLAKKETTNA